MKHPFFVGQVLPTGYTIVAIDSYNVPNGDLANSAFSILYLYKQGEGIKKVTIGQHNEALVEGAGTMPALRAQVLYPKQDITPLYIVQGGTSLVSGVSDSFVISSSTLNKYINQ